MNYVAAPPNTWNIHLETAGGLLLVINALDLFAYIETFAGEKINYTASVGETVASARTKRAWIAGMSVFDISNPALPRKIGQLDVDGIGFHRLWYVGGVTPMPRHCSMVSPTISSSPSTGPTRQDTNLLAGGGCPE